MKPYFGMALMIAGIFIFIWVGIEQILFLDRLPDGVINLVIGIFGTYSGYRILKSKDKKNE